MKEVCVLAFEPPPPHWGFKRSRAGTSWYILLAADRVPACLAALRQRGIRGLTAWEEGWRDKFYRALAQRGIVELSPEQRRAVYFLTRWRGGIDPLAAACLITTMR